MGSLLLLFVGLPAVELYLLIQIGTAIGAAATVGVIVVTGIVGATMARSQGLRILSEVQQELATGRLPAASLIDGLMILVAAALLVTPGVLTDVFGFLCLLPGFRRIARGWLLRRLQRAVEEQRVALHVEGVGFEAFDGTGRGPFQGEGGPVHGEGGPLPGEGGPIIDIDPRPTDGREPTRRPR